MGSDDLQMVMMDPAGVIVREIAAGVTQRQVAQTYAIGLRQAHQEPFDAKRANEAIIERWSLAGLARIKDAAWSARWRGGHLFEAPNG